VLRRRNVAAVRWSGCGSLLALLLAVSDAAAADRRLELRPCAVKGVAMAECARYEVFEDRGAAGGRRIALRIVVLPRKEQPGHPDPLFVLAGGPGQAATDNADFFARVFSAVQRERDIVLIDQRGTGESNPLNCDLYGTTAQAHLGDLLPLDRLQQCAEQWRSAADLRFYTTDVAMADLDEVRDALGYEKINLFGTSYGTRAAQVYMRSYPQRVRSVIMKGVTPITTPLTMPMARDAQRALDQLSADCAADKECRAAFPNLKRDVKAVLAKLESAVDVEIGTNGSREQVSISRAAVAPTLRSLLQSIEGTARVPLLIRSAAEGDYAPLAEAALAIRRGFPKAVSIGLFLAIASAEDVAISDDKKVARASRGTFLRDDYYQQLKQAASLFPPVKMPAGYRAPVTSNAPTLLISGFLDPATPPSGADAVAKRLPNSRHVVVRNGSHAYGGMSPCVDEIMGAFIARGSADGLNTSCVDKIERPPFAATLEKGR
jgi:pimeloyl-ACP methyl ester carboxylesterase